MRNRPERIQLIKKIISEEVISNQDELQFRLKDLGCEVTQATLSRDLKLMHVVKINDAQSGYVYRLSDNGATGSPAESGIAGSNFLANTVVGIDFSGNLGVLKTLPGYASSIAIIIDKANASELLGTIAGDDTILLIIREGFVRNDVIELLKKIIPGLENKI